MKLLHYYQTLDSRLYHHQMPNPLHAPKLVHLNVNHLKKLNLPSSINWQEIIGGNLRDLAELDNSINPLAMVYAGHQFGQWAGRLGDGRGLLIGEIQDNAGKIIELHLKGSGKTPYSRYGDGRAMIHSTVREYLCGHALNHLNIPSSDALGFVISETPIQRYQIERAAMLLRSSDCHVRLGHLEYVCLYTPDYFSTFIDKIILRYYPHFHRDCTAKPTDILGFMREICHRTASLIAAWQLIGFSHGVMNTDNLNLTGSTLDFGPFGFMEQFNPRWVNNQSDHQARYCYQNQPAIGLWNLQTVFKNFYKLSIKDADISDVLDEYESVFLQTYHQGLMKKLGLMHHKDSDEQSIHLAYDFLDIIKRTKSDYTNSFRMLIALWEPDTNQYPHEHRLLRAFVNQLGCHQNDWRAWQQSYFEQINILSPSQKQKSLDMLTNNNPVVVPRNHMLNAAINQVLLDDFSEVERLFKIFQNPYNIQEIITEKDVRAAQDDEQISISCMS